MFDRRRSSAASTSSLPQVRQTVLKEGWLQKQSAHIGRWKQRWCVLTPDALITYKAPSQTSDKDPYPLAHCSEASKDTSKISGREYGIVFNVKGRRDYLLLAASAQERDAWIMQFNRVRAELARKSQLAQSMPADFFREDPEPNLGRSRSFSGKADRLDSILAPRGSPNASFNQPTDPKGPPQVEAVEAQSTRMPHKMAANPGAKDERLELEVVEFEAVDRPPGTDHEAPSRVYFKIAVRPPGEEVHHVMKSFADLQILRKDLAPEFEKVLPNLPPAPRQASPEEARLPLNAFLGALASKRKVCSSKHFGSFFKLSHDFSPTQSPATSFVASWDAPPMGADAASPAAAMPSDTDAAKDALSAAAMARASARSRAMVARRVSIVAEGEEQADEETAEETTTRDLHSGSMAAIEEEASATAEPDHEPPENGDLPVPEQGWKSNSALFATVSSIAMLGLLL